MKTQKKTENSDTLEESFFWVVGGFRPPNKLFYFSTRENVLGRPVGKRGGASLNSDPLPLKAVTLQSLAWKALALKSSRPSAPVPVIPVPVDPHPFP